MLQELQISGFKGFRNFHLTDLARVTLIGGKNNVGKTSLLEAIFLFYDITEPRMLFDHLRWRGINRAFRDAESLVSPLFTDFNMNNNISFQMKDGLYTSKMDISFNPSDVQKTADIDVSNTEDTMTSLKMEATTTTLHHINIHYQVSDVGQEDAAIVLRQTAKNVEVRLAPHTLTITPSEIRHDVIFSPLRTRMDSWDDSFRFSQLGVGRGTSRAVNFLRVIEPRLTDLTLLAPHPGNPLIYADIQGMNRKVPVALLGDGMSKLLSIILTIATTNNGIILIDEIEAGMHHSVLPKVWEGIFRAAKDFNCQIIATTHSYECLQSAYYGASEAQAEEDFSYIRLDSHENNIVTKHYSHGVLGAALEDGLEVR